MVEARVGVQVADDRKSVTIEIGPVEELFSPVASNLEQLTKVITLLGQARSRMVEATRKQPLDGTTLGAVIEPPWYIQVAQIDGSLFAFDHPAYGLDAFATPRDDIVRIVRILSAHLALPAVQPERPS